MIYVKTNSTPVVHIKIAGKWMFIPLKMVLISHYLREKNLDFVGNLSSVMLADRR